MPRRQDFDPSVPLPPVLEIVAIQKAIQYVERKLKDWITRKDIRIKGGKPVPKNGDVEVAATR